ncbi:MAG: BrnT family toxin [Candidatus Omnitrophica bacterium]|nr:BrnT family toxin [Candidatus Omnitrophota bacterium]
MEKVIGNFIWNYEKEVANIHKHGINFITAAKVFKDTKRKIYIDSKHSVSEERFFCIGKVEGIVITVRFTYREDKIRIFGAGHWKKGEKYYYEKEKD